MIDIPSTDIVKDKLNFADGNKFVIKGCSSNVNTPRGPGINTRLRVTAVESPAAAKRTNNFTISIWKEFD